MDQSSDRVLHVPHGVPIARFIPSPTVAVPNNAELPLFDRDAPAEKKLQQVWVARTRVFNFNNQQDLVDYEAVLQKIVDQQAVELSGCRVDFNAGVYTALLRWAEFVYKLPKV